ncbi:hypothetical protein K469DRAFT_93652 [Zopfia rhizophila CBS 207.26]|uniref:Apple domain-containing protein n=1 Tax=Zopfia rhizophila CBS 207.26 TaxID=1314779 RepID=A0A6A6E8L4_9PEZI|nr:hypothetical protein K469DRAFT_93652 [Zopfia rhizophila CBS 207.26]
MATQIPDINVIQDTPRDGPAQPHTLPTTLPRSPQYSTAPEVDLSNRDAEGLQVDLNGPYPEPTTESRPKAQWWPFSGSPQKQVVNEDGGLFPVEKSPRRERRICGMKRKTFVLVLIVVILVICAAVGGGVGGYEASKKKSEPEYVTSGTTGMAKRPCAPQTATAPGAPAATPSGIPNPYLATGATFNITCQRGVQADAKVKGKPIANMKRFVKYTFTDCIDECAKLTECAGVTYGANLTNMLEDGDPGGNCLLKNGTWDASADRADWFASAVKE